MDTSCSLIIDQGTHATRTMAVDKGGRIQASASKPVSLFRISDTHVEQDGNEILASVHQTLGEVLAAAGSRQLAFSCAGLATQRSSVVAWDRGTGLPLFPVISWQDRRVGEWLDQFRDKNNNIQRLTGLPLSPHYGAGKLRWLLDNVPAVRHAHGAGRLAWGPLASFLLFHLSREKFFLVDHANAQRTQLWNLQTRQWDKELMDLFQLPMGCLPSCAPICGGYGWLKDADIPITAVSGDQTAAFFNLGRMPVGAAAVNIGTGAFILSPTGAYPVFHAKLLSGIAASFENKAEYVLEGTVNGAGAALDWAIETWKIQNLYGRLPAWLSRYDSPPVFINAVGGIGSPWWRPNAVSQLIGDGGPGERAVAVAESILFLIMANLDTMTVAGCDIRQLVITGGLSRMDGVCQRLADLTKKPVYRPAETEATVRGGAWLAFGRPKKWPKPGRGKWFRPDSHPALIVRYRRFCELMGD